MNRVPVISWGAVDIQIKQIEKQHSAPFLSSSCQASNSSTELGKGFSVLGRQQNPVRCVLTSRIAGLQPHQFMKAFSCTCVLNFIYQYG